MRGRAQKLLPLDQWPDADHNLWRAAIRPGDRFDSGGPAASWAERSRWTVCQGYRRWLGYIEAHEPGAFQLCPADRVTESRVANYVETLQATITPSGTHNYVKHLYDAMRVMSPDHDWVWLERLARSLGRLVETKSKRHKVVPAHDLVALGFQLMAEATRELQLDQRRSPLKYRDGLIIALLATRPIRRRNLAMIRIGQHLVTDVRPFRLVFGAHETKTHTELDIQLPDFLTPAIEAYLTTWRPKVCRAEAHDGLWASAKGLPMSSEAIYDCVRKRTREALGHPINLHLFRDCAATTIALENPAHIGIAADLLGHTDVAMTERYYIQADTLHAAESHSAGLQSVRDKLRAKQ